MPMDIAVYVDQKGDTTSLYDKGMVRVYQRKQGEWNLVREKDFDLGNNLSIKDLRGKMKEVVEFLDSCKTFVGLSITGIPYFELEKTNCSVWEYEGDPVHFLDYVLEKEEEQIRNSQEQKSTAPPAPVETFSGCFRISLKEIQENNTGFTSKQVLLPFIRQGHFYSLEVLCNHIPPWLETELQIGNLEGRSETIGKNDIKLTITKKCCQ